MQTIRGKTAFLVLEMKVKKDPGSQVLLVVAKQEDGVLAEGDEVEGED